MEKFNLEFCSKNINNKNLKVYLVEYRLDGKKPNIMEVEVKCYVNNKVFFIPIVNNWFTNILKHRDINVSLRLYVAEYNNNEYEVRAQNFLLGDLYYHVHEENELHFLCDSEKIIDFIDLSKSDFLSSYSYLSEEEYDETQKIFDKLIDNQH